MSRPHLKHPLVVLLLVLSCLGLADSAYLAHSALTGSPLACSVSGLSGCNVVAQSVYSHLFGIPLGVYGVIFYGFLFIIASLLFVIPSKLAHVTLVVLGVVGSIASLIFLYLQVFVINAVCVYCLASALISFLTFALTFWLWKEFAQTPFKVVTPIPEIAL